MYKPETDFELLARNITKHRWLIAVSFAIISLGLTALGYFTPKQYSSSSTLIINNGRIITPLLDNAAVPKDNAALAIIAKEIIQSRKTLVQLGQRLGVIEGNVDSFEEEVALNKLRGRVGVSLEGDRYMQTTYIDDKPELAQKGATILAELFMGENQGGKAKESKNAYEFIDTQVKQYHKKLLAAEEKLKGFRAQKLESGATSEEAITMRVQSLQTMLDQATLDLKEAYVQKRSLEQQLQGEVTSTISLSKQSQYIGRIQRLKDELARLRLNYQESYPDIVDLKHQIADLERAMEQEKRNSETRSALGVVDDSVRVNKVYQDLKLRASNINTRVATLQTRVAELKRNIANERKKGRQVSNVDAMQSELTRDYNVNKNIYEDLLKRREKARVSMEVESDSKNSSITLFEPAYLPVKPNGLRFLHYIIAGLFLGMMLPVAGIYLFQIIDSKVKSVHLLTSKMKVPVLASVETIRNDVDMRIESGGRITRTLFYLATFLSIAVIAYLRLKPGGS
ncbi:MAG TPA: hypothetical protein EYH06_12490 [Chromatiales bacterium]|nr:hypothetical protein [Chromatiales bacterium]